MADLQKLENTVLALRSSLKKLEHVEQFCQKSKEVLLKEKQSSEAKFASNQHCISAVKEQLSENSEKVVDQVSPSLQKNYIQQLLVLETDEIAYIKKAELERKQILKRSHQKFMKTDDKFSALQNWWTEIQNGQKNEDGVGLANRLFYNASFQDQHGDVQLLSFSTKYKGFCVHMKVFHNRNDQPFQDGLQYHVTSDIYVTHIQEHATRYLNSDTSISIFVAEVIWKYLEDELFPIL